MTVCRPVSGKPHLGMSEATQASPSGLFPREAPAQVPVLRLSHLLEKKPAWGEEQEENHSRQRDQRADPTLTLEQA